MDNTLKPGGAEMTEVTQEDREAAASGYFAWCSGNPVIPKKMLNGNADDHSMIQAFARHRIASDLAGYERGQRETVERIVAELRKWDKWGPAQPADIAIRILVEFGE